MPWCWVPGQSTHVYECLHVVSGPQAPAVGEVAEPLCGIPIRTVEESPIIIRHCQACMTELAQLV